MEVQETAVQTDRILTIPNVLSFIRLLGVPLFLWLILKTPPSDGWAVAVLLIAGATDYFDGKIARATGQISRLGQLLDPLADRLYILATLIGLVVRDIVPLWFALLLIGRDVILAIALIPLRRRGVVGLPVTFLGKAATFNLLYALPLLLLGAGYNHAESVWTQWQGWCFMAGWACAIWGLGLYLWTGVMYLSQTYTLLKTLPKQPRSPKPAAQK
jgi:cardiolipin synthase